MHFPDFLLLSPLGPFFLSCPSPTFKSFFKKKKTHWITVGLSVRALVWIIYWSMGNLPVATPRKKNDFCSPNSSLTRGGASWTLLQFMLECQQVPSCARNEFMSSTAVSCPEDKEFQRCSSPISSSYIYILSTFPSVFLEPWVGVSVPACVSQILFRVLSSYMCQP